MIMGQSLFYGELVRLCAIEPQEYSKAISQWARDSEYSRLLSGRFVCMQSSKHAKEQIIQEQEQTTLRFIEFEIRALQKDSLLGSLGIELDDWMHGDAFVSIGLGERDYWNQGYGTDAMQVLLRYAFCELNLHRVSLNAFEYNQRALRVYEKIGFAYEGCAKQQVQRDGRRWDMIFMGILGEEWQQCNPEAVELVKEI